MAHRISSRFTDLNLTDHGMLLKLFTREVAKKIVIHEDKFGVESELVAQGSAVAGALFEIGITYDGRTYEEGTEGACTEVAELVLLQVSPDVFRRGLSSERRPADTPVESLP